MICRLLSQSLVCYLCIRMYSKTCFEQRKFKSELAMTRCFYGSVSLLFKLLRLCESEFEREIASETLLSRSRRLNERESEEIDVSRTRQSCNVVLTSWVTPITRGCNPNLTYAEELSPQMFCSSPLNNGQSLVAAFKCKSFIAILFDSHRGNECIFP